MKRNFDFEEMGKKIPYQVPDAFFEEMQKNVMARTCTKKPNIHFILRLAPVVAAAAAVLAAVLYLPVHDYRMEQVSITQAKTVDESWIEHISDEDLQLMSDFSDYDIFMNQ